MEIINTAEHEKCPYHDHSELPMVEVRKIEQGHEDEMTFSRNEIVFMLEGEIRFTFRGHPDKEIAKGHFIFIPVGRVFRYKTIRRSMVLVIRLNSRMQLCPSFLVERLYEESKAEGDPECPEAIGSLEINTHLWNYLHGLSSNIAAGLRCRHYFETKTQELFFLLRVYYPKDRLYEFFSLILSPDTAFSEHVRIHFMKYRTVKEFAASMNLTTKQFTARFHHVFGLAPYAWMKRERTQLIYLDILEGTKDNKQIAHDYGFAGTNHLWDYCKKEMGKTLGEIRERKQEGPNME